MEVFAQQRLEYTRRIGVIAAGHRDLAALAELLIGLRAFGVQMVVHIGPLDSPAVISLEADLDHQVLYLVDGTAAQASSWIDGNLFQASGELSVLHATGTALRFIDGENDRRLIVTPPAADAAEFPMAEGDALIIDMQTLDVTELA